MPHYLSPLVGKSGRDPLITKETNNVLFVDKKSLTKEEFVTFKQKTISTKIARNQNIPKRVLRSDISAYEYLNVHHTCT